MSRLEAVALLAWRQHGLEIQRYILILPLPWQHRGAWDEVSYDRYQLSGLLGPGCCGWDLGDRAVAGDGYCALSHEGC